MTTEQDLDLVAGLPRGEVAAAGEGGAGGGGCQELL